MARPLSAFAFRVHTHALGVEVYAERLAAGAWPKDDEDGTDGTPAAAATTNADDPFPAVRLMARDPQLPQLFERIDDRKITIHPGDVIRVTCIFDTRNRTQVTRAGWSHGDEMCNLYMMVHAEEPAYLSCNGARGNGRTRMEIQHSPDSSQASAQPPDDPSTMTAHLVDAPAGAWPKSLGQIAGIVAEPDGRHAWAFHRGKRIWDGDSFDPRHERCQRFGFAHRREHDRADRARDW
jgi:peptidylamidoglycolate lyase